MLGTWCIDVIRYPCSFINISTVREVTWQWVRVKPFEGNHWISHQGLVARYYFWHWRGLAEHCWYCNWLDCNWWDGVLFSFSEIFFYFPDGLFLGNQERFVPSFNVPGRLKLCHLYIICINFISILNARGK